MRRFRDQPRVGVCFCCFLHLKVPFHEPLGTPVSPRWQPELLTGLQCRPCAGPWSRQALVLTGWPRRGSLNGFQDITVPTVFDANRWVSLWCSGNSAPKALCSVTCSWDGSLVSSVKRDTSNVADPKAWDEWKVGEGRQLQS